MVQGIPFVDANRDDDVHLHPCGLRVPIALILDRKISSPLVLPWGNFGDKKESKKTQEKTYGQTVYKIAVHLDWKGKTQEKTYRQTVHKIAVQLDWKGKNTRSLSRIKLLSLLGTPCCYPLLLVVLRRSRKLLASSGLCVGSCYFFVVYPDVWLKQIVVPCSRLVQTCKKTSRLV